MCSRDDDPTQHDPESRETSALGPMPESFSESLRAIRAIDALRAAQRSIALTSLNEAIRTAGMLRTEQVTITAPLARYLRDRLAAGVGVPADPAGLREAAQAVDAGWHVVEGDERRESVRLRYASDLPARLNALRAALAATPTAATHREENDHD